MSEVGKQIVESLEQLVADTKAIPAGVPILEGLKSMGYQVTSVRVISGGSHEQSLADYEAGNVLTSEEVLADLRSRR